MNNATNFANRYGLNLKIYEYVSSGTHGATELLTVDFANETSLNVTGSNTWAKGGQRNTEQIGFSDPKQGTFKISTQIRNVLLEKLAAGLDIGAATASDFGVKITDSDSNPVYYIIEGDTVWKDDEGTTYTETIILYKATVKVNVSKTYKGEGDAQSFDIEFDLKANPQGDIAEILYADTVTPTPAGSGSGQEG